MNAECESVRPGIAMSEYRLLISSEDIQDRVYELAEQLSNDYAGKNPLIITLLKGAFIFSADLVRHLAIPHEIDFITLSSYRNGALRSEKVEILNHLRTNPAGRDIIVIDEIIDTGHTLANLMKTLDTCKSKSLEICTLLDKPASREVDIPVRYVGFRIPSVFVVGYGLDFKEQYRNIPYIAVIEQDIKKQGDWGEVVKIGAQGLEK